MVESVEKMEQNEFFKEAYIVMVNQPLDHNNPEKGTFLQRVILSHYNYENPVVLITEGYHGNYAASKKYINELCPIFEANQIFVEHRYFGKSVPDSLDWEYLTVANAAADHHSIVNMFRTIYSGKWISTGISKGGSTVLYHRALYPEDVDLSVPYVAPINLVEEEKRNVRFIEECAGTAEYREKVKAFQDEVLNRKKRLLKMLEEYCKDKNYTFRAPLNEIFDYCVLEYSFSFWQWGTSPDSIPSSDATDEVIFNHLVNVCSPDYFAIEGQEAIKAFFVQAAKELGYYAYDAKEFKGKMNVESTKGYVKRLFLPENVKFRFSPEMGRKVKRYINKDADKVLFIYGGWDPWTASGVDINGNKDLMVIVKEGGDHRTRINNLPDEQKKAAISVLKEWLAEEE